MEYHIQLIEQFDARLICPINQLLGQLTSRQIEFSADDLQRLIESDSSHLFILSAGDTIAGMLTLGVYLTPTGRKVWIEDVVVDSRFRGQGLGHRLVGYAVEYAHRFAPCKIALTSNPLRIEANKLYRSEGFEQRCTNVYKMDI